MTRPILAAMARICTLVWLLLALLLAACSSQPIALSHVFPGAGTLPGWTPTGEAEVFDRENIYDPVNGQAEAFFAYGFEQVAIQSYENTGGAVLRVEVWQLATPADAYGLFTASISGTPATVGNEGDADPGRRLAFWQDCYYVHVRARQGLNDADGSTELAQVLWGFAEAVSAALPEGGERPALVGRLPPAGLVERSAIFFHQEISIQDQLWLGGANLLGLSPETDAVLARYAVGGAVARLLLVQYPDAEAASAGLAALEDSQISGLVTADVRDNLLGAVFGEVDAVTADKLLSEATGDR